MINKVNYQKILDKTLEDIEKSGAEKSLLLHSCCAPCSSYVLEYLSNFFNITVLYYNPNIYPYEEYIYRKEEQKRLISEMNFKKSVSFMDCDYDNTLFNEVVKGFEAEPEGGKRCEKCFHLRLYKTAEIAKNNGFDYFTTTLTISPLKNAEILNKKGLEAEAEYGVSYLVSDFKKKNGYKRSIELSHKFSLYRQNFCGCIYSKKIL